MNVCLLNDSFPPQIDGVANTVVNYGENLKKHGHNPLVVTPKCPGAEEDEKYDFPILRYPGIDVRDQVGYVAGYPFSPHVIQTLGENHVDIMHSHCPAASTVLARSMRKQLNTPIVMTYHTKFDIDIANAVKGKLIQTGAIKALVDNVTACDEVWVVSDGAGQNLKSLGYEGDYIVMENGVDVPKARLPEAAYMKMTEGYDLPQDLPIFLFVGRMMWYKGIRIIVDALAALRSQGIDFRMVFVGKGADMEEIQQYVSSLRLDNQVIFTGPIYDREELSAWYCRADLFLFPSSYDTNGLVVREAAACSLASVMIKGSCAAEGVTDRKNGYFIEENAASLAVLLTQISSNKEEMHRCGQAASDDLYISWEQAVAKAEERYQIVIDNYKSGKIRKHHRPQDEFFVFQGELMDMLAAARQNRIHLENKAMEWLERYF
ncbi:MAG: glycosyltransferase [Lachnospiraceae bacterium]|nr:glycosyltransferase [Candidatus Equihabitans merdae]